MTTSIEDPDLARAALTDARLDVVAVDPTGAAATIAWLRASVARFTPAARHQPRRARIERILAGIDPATLRIQAAARTRAALLAGPVDLMAAVARPVPVTVLARQLGATGDVTADALAVAGAYLPPATADAGADAAVARMVAAFGGRADEECAARISLLAQAGVATATLVGRAARRWLIGADREATAAVAAALRDDPPVPATRRVSHVDTEFGPAGTVVTVALPGPFGHGRHACPGAEHATALAAGVLDALSGARLLDPDRLLVGAA